MSKEDSEFQKKLSNLSCPFTWNIDNAITSYYTLRRHERKEDDDDEEDCSVLIKNMINALMTCYQQMLKNNKEKYEEKLKDAEEFWEKIKDLKSKELDGTRNSFDHVINATKCHILYKQENIKEAEKVLLNIVNVSCMTRKEVGALNGIQSAAWSLYHEFGKDKAVELATNAIRLNRENSFWHFILAKNLRRCRRIISMSSIPGKTEREGFKKAYNVSKNPYYGVYLAQMYRESTYRLTSRQQKKDTEKKIFAIYNEIMGSDDLSGFIISRLTLGFIRMTTINTYELADKCLKILEKKSEEHELHATYSHYKGLFLQRFERHNVTERLKYFKAAAECNNFPAEMDYVKDGINAGLDPIEHLKKMLIKYASSVKERQQTMLLALASCYYLKRDIKNAANYYLKALEIDPDGQQLKIFYKFSTFSTKSTKSIYGFLVSELLPKLKASSDASLKEIYLKIEQLCQEHMPGNTTSLDDYMKDMKL